MTSSLLSRWQRRIAVLMPPLMVAAFAFTLFDSLGRRRESARMVEHTYRVIGDLSELRGRLVDAETGLRGYVITGDTVYLEPFRNARGDARGLLVRLRGATRDNPAQQRSLDLLTPLVTLRLDFMDARVRIRRDQGFEAARVAPPNSAGGKQTMDHIRGVLAGMQSEERRLLALRERSAGDHDRTVLWILFAGTALVLAAAVLTGVLFGRDARQRALLNDELRSANGTLQEQAAELEVQTEELQSQAAQLEETMSELESTNEELVTQRGQLEEATVELAEANHRLYAANEALESRTADAEAANRAKTEFLTGMSHELRTPLNAIAGYADLMELGVHGPLTDAQRTALARIRYNERHLLALINDVLNFAKLGAGKLELRLADVGVGELLGEMGVVVEPMIQARELSFVTEPCELPIRARGDRDRIAQILLNLLSNAVKCTDPGGQVRMWAEADAGHVRIHVADTGRGIAREKQDVIFDPFVQLTPGGALAEGVGLGLSISRELARAMQGELSVESAPGQGSTFTLTLPHARRVSPQKIVDSSTWSDETQTG